MSTEQNTGHVAQALARLPQQYRDKVKIEALVSAITGPVQDLEDALWDLFTKRQVDTAEGQQLDDLGSLVGEERQGRSDTDYRRFIRARISTNRSKGTMEDILTVTPLILDDANATLNLGNSGTATVVLKIEDTASDADVVDILILFLRDVVAAGVRVIVELGITAPATWANFDIDTFDTAGDVFVGAVD